MKTFINLAFGGIVLLFGIVFLFQPVRQSPPTKEDEQLLHASSVNVATGETAIDDVSDSEPQQEPTIYEAAILTAFGEETRNTQEGSDAADFIGMTINMSGHLCARPVEAQKGSGYQYGIGCITRNGSPHRSNYLLDIDNGTVVPI